MQSAVGIVTLCWQLDRIGYLDNRREEEMKACSQGPTVDSGDLAACLEWRQAEARCIE